MAMSLLESMFTVKHKATDNIDGQTGILTVVLSLKEGKKAKVFGKSQGSRNQQTNMKEITLMITNMASVNSIGHQVDTFQASTNTT